MNAASKEDVDPEIGSMLLTASVLLSYEFLDGAVLLGFADETC